MTIARRVAAPADFEADPQKVARVGKILEERGVRTCYAVFVDVNGVPKSKATPMECFAQMCNGHELYTVGATEGMGLAGPHEDECATIPDLDSLIVFPWDSTQAWFNADLYYHGEPYWGDARAILRRQLARLRSHGLTFNLGIEPEFYVLKRDGDGHLAPITQTRYQGPNACYDLNLSTESLSFLEPMQDYLQSLGWGLFSYDQECGRGQHEFDFGYADALTMCDRFIFLRFMARKVAQSLGALVTFMPKPFSNDFRSGAHFNMSLADADGRNQFELDAGRGTSLGEDYGTPQSDLAHHFTAGLLNHAGAVTATTCPTYNSYQGLTARGDLADFSWAPILVAWGNNNRSAMLRMPLNRACVENRAVDMSCNPYLTAALSLAAGLEGIEQQADPGAPINDDIYHLNRKQLREAGISTLPPTLLHALEAFAADPISEQAFGAAYKEVYLDYKLSEWERNFFRVSEEQRESTLTYI